MAIRLADCLNIQLCCLQVVTDSDLGPEVEKLVFLSEQKRKNQRKKKSRKAKALLLNSLVRECMID